MTLYGLLASLAWTATAVLCISRIDAAFRLWIAQRPTSSALMPTADIPDDLLAFAMGETEPWAQHQALAVIRERYDQFHDWNRVRAAIGAGQV